MPKGGARTRSGAAPDVSGVQTSGDHDLAVTQGDGEIAAQRGKLE